MRGPRPADPVRGAGSGLRRTAGPGRVCDRLDYRREVGVPEDELYMGDDRLVDPAGHGPRLWFQQVPEGKVVKNRLNLDLRISGGGDLPIEPRDVGATDQVITITQCGLR